MDRWTRRAEPEFNWESPQQRATGNENEKAGGGFLVDDEI